MRKISVLNRNRNRSVDSFSVPKDFAESCFAKCEPSGALDLVQTTASKTARSALTNCECTPFQPSHRISRPICRIRIPTAGCLLSKHSQVKPFHRRGVHPVPAPNRKLLKLISGTANPVHCGIFQQESAVT